LPAPCNVVDGNAIVEQIASRFALCILHFSFCILLGADYPRLPLALAGVE
jgi:hypothetical protein